MDGNKAKKKKKNTFVSFFTPISFPWNYSFIFEECYTFNIFVGGVELNWFYALLSFYKS